MILFRIIMPKKFEYTDDLLMPQNSYFVNSKLKFLILETSGENCDSENYYLFDSKNDSIYCIVNRQKCYESPDRWTITSDTIFITDYIEKVQEKYANGILIKKETNNNLRRDFRYIYEIKLNTEKKYNSG